MPKATAPVTNFYIPQQQTRWVEWISEDDPSGQPFRARVRAELMWGEIEALTFTPETPTTDVHAAIAPYVFEWNAGRLGKDGQPEALPAPADGGPDVFKEIPNTFFWWLFREIKLHATQQLPKASPTQPAIMAVPRSESA